MMLLSEITTVQKINYQIWWQSLVRLKIS